MNHRYVIVGMGAAGISAAEAIRTLDARGEIVLISAENEGYYSRPGLAYFLTKELREKDLYPFSEQDFKRLTIKRIIGIAQKIDNESKLLYFNDSKSIHYDTLLIAVGAAAVRPDLQGLDLDGVVYLDSMQQTRSMIKVSRRFKTAVVVGGGITALELAEGLNARGVKVHYLLRGDRYWNRVLDGVESKIILRRLVEEGISIHLNTEIKSIHGNRGKVKGIVTEDGRFISCQIVGIAVGVKPRLGIAQASGIIYERGIKVNEYMQTNLPDVFAAGDVAQVFDPQANRWVVDSLWSLARHQGWIAGLNMAGEKSEHVRSTPFNVTRLAGLTTTIIGMVGSDQPADDLAIVRGESQTWHQRPDAVVCQDSFDVNRIRILVGKGHIIGAVVMGNQTISRPIEDLVVNQVDICSIRERLLEPDAPLAELILNFWKSWRTTDAN